MGAIEQISLFRLDCTRNKLRAIARVPDNKKGLQLRRHLVQAFAVNEALPINNHAFGIIAQSPGDRPPLFIKVEDNCLIVLRRVAAGEMSVFPD